MFVIVFVKRLHVLQLTFSMKKLVDVNANLKNVPVAMNSIQKHVTVNVHNNNARKDIDSINIVVNVNANLKNVIMDIGGTLILAVVTVKSEIVHQTTSLIV